MHGLSLKINSETCHVGAFYSRNSASELEPFILYTLERDSECHDTFSAFSIRTKHKRGAEKGDFHYYTVLLCPRSQPNIANIANQTKDRSHGILEYAFA